MKMMRYLLILLISVGVSTTVAAQWNLSIGYSGGYTTDDTYADLSAEYNKRNQDTLLNDLNPFRYVNGLVGTLRYRYGGVGVEFQWYERFGGSTARGVSLDDDPGRTFRTVDYRHRSLMLGGTLFLTENISVGGTYGFDLFRMSTEVNNFLDKKVVDERGTGSRFFIALGLDGGSDALTVELQPYIWVNWGEYDLSNLRDKFFPNDAPVETKAKFNHFGINLLFYNGAKY